MYGKVFTSLWQGTLYGRSQEQLVFVYLIAHADSEGFVDISPKVIADATGIPEGDVVRSLAFLEGPDFKSRSQEQQGARLERIDEHRDWGWRIVNYEKYRTMVDADTRKAQNRAAQRRRRQHLSSPVSNGQHPSAQEEVEVDAEAIESKDLVTSPIVSETPEHSRSPISKKRRSPEDIEWEKTFHEWFWPDYWRKVSKTEALSSWMKISPKSQDTVDAIAVGFSRHNKVMLGREMESRPHASTWLNQRRWEDPDA